MLAEAGGRAALKEVKENISHTHGHRAFDGASDRLTY